MKKKVKVLTVWASQTVYHPMNCSLPGFSVHGILQARTLELSTHSFLQEILSRDWTQVSCIACRFFTTWVTREASPNACGKDTQTRLKPTTWYLHPSFSTTGPIQGRASSSLGSCEGILQQNMVNISGNTADRMPQPPHTLSSKFKVY